MLPSLLISKKDELNSEGFFFRNQLEVSSMVVDTSRNMIAANQNLQAQIFETRSKKTIFMWIHFLIRPG